MNAKLNFRKIGKILGVILFLIILFTNIKIALSNDEDLTSGFVNILGLKIEVFEPIKAGTVSLCGEICTSQPNLVCTYLVGTGYCFGQWK